MPELKKTVSAIALAYDRDQDKAPLVVATGAGFLAEKIIETADRLNIPVYKDETAATLLCQLDLGQEIPPELYQVVATIYASILKVAEETRQKKILTPEPVAEAAAPQE